MRRAARFRNHRKENRMKKNNKSRVLAEITGTALESPSGGFLVEPPPIEPPPIEPPPIDPILIAPPI